MTAIIETKRLFLRELAHEDFDALYAVFSDAESMQHYPYPFDEARVRGWIERNIERYRILGFGLWAVCLKESGEMIGDCGLTMQSINGVICPEIGYHIRKDKQRSGYAKEAAAAVRDWAFENTPFRTLFSYCKYTNVPSCATAASIGMRFVKEFADEVNDFTRVHAISKAEWLYQKSGWVFRKAVSSDKHAVKALYSSVIGSEYSPWDEYYPGEEHIDSDLSHGNLYVLLSGADIIGAVSVTHENELDGLDFWTATDSAAEIARVCVARHMHGNGISRILISEIEKVLLERGYKAIRLLVAKRNIPAYRTYLGVGFTVRGDCTMYDIDFYACEKALSR